MVARENVGNYPAAMKRRKQQPRPPEILRKGGPMKDRSKYDRKRQKPRPATSNDEQK